MLNKEIVISLHIPKTGGLSMSEVLRSVYADRFCHTGQVDNLETKHDVPSNVACVHGHLPYGVHKYFSQRCVYITMLRTPSCRAISYAHHSIQASKKDYRWKEIGISPGMNLAQFFKLPICSNNNAMIRQLCGLDFMEEESKIEIDASRLKQAKSHVEQHFRAVGFCEYYQESLEKYQLALGWDELPGIQYMNLGKYDKKEKLDHDVVALIEENNCWDQQLYDWALLKFSH